MKRRFKNLSLKGYFIVLIILIIIPFEGSAQKGKYKKACNENTIYEYQSFLRKYPTSEFYSDIRNRLIDLEFEKAKKYNAIYLYEDFLEKYPESKFTNEATNCLIELEFERAKKPRYSEVSAMKDFLEKYPESKFTDEAKKYIIDWEFKLLRFSNNNINDYKNFLAKYPENDYVDTVNSIIEKIEFDEERDEFNEAKSINTIRSFKAYIVKYPEGNYSDSANILIGLISANYERNMDGFIKASKNGDLEMIKIFVTEGFNVNLKDDEGKTALSSAVLSIRPEIVEYLLLNGAQPLTNILCSAAGLEHLFFYKVASDAFSKFGYTNKNSKTTKQLEKDHFMILELLINNGVKSSSSKSDECSPLVTAVASGNMQGGLYYAPKVVKLLIDNGDKISIREKEVKTALEMTTNHLIKEILEEY